ncbi:MAG TPA: hypothetical protein VEO20_10425 [Thermoplasmata archaeon]|nr:hypothetical protein [Thermoplasmata archaeon]
MRGMRSHLVRDRLQSFARAQRSRSLEIVSYDIPGHDKALSVQIARFVFGSRTKARVRGGLKEYHYPGFIEKEGVVWLGQSVFLLTPHRSRELRDFLGAGSVAYGHLNVRVDKGLLKNPTRDSGAVRDSSDGSGFIRRLIHLYIARVHPAANA